MIEVINIIENEKALEQFLALAGDVYRKDAFYCPQSEDVVHKNLFEGKFKKSQKLYLVLEDGRPVGRVVSRINTKLLDEDHNQYGMIGFFEALDKPDAIKALLREAISGLNAQGAKKIIGPMEGDTWHRYRLNTGPFDSPPFLMELYNPDYYPALWESSGFELFEKYYSKHVPDIGQAMKGLEKNNDKLITEGYKLRHIDLHRFSEELELLYDLSCSIFKNNFLYTRISKEEFLGLYDGVKPLIESELIWFAQAPDGTNAGFIFAFPDRFEAVRSMRGSKSLFAKFRFLLKRNKTETVNMKSMGVVENHL